MNSLRKLIVIWWIYRLLKILSKKTEYVEAEGFWLDRCCNEGNEYVGKKNSDNNYVVKQQQTNTDTDPDVIIKVEKYPGGWRCDLMKHIVNPEVIKIDKEPEEQEKPRWMTIASYESILLIIPR
jgi:hypothetical protein